MVIEAESAEESREVMHPRRRFPIQWNLRTLLLLTAAVALWVASLHLWLDNRRIEQEITPLRQMARSLIVEDRRQIAVVKLDDLWYDEERWDVYLPEGAYAIRLAMHEIGDKGLAPVAEEARILPGRHRIELHNSKAIDVLRLAVLVDGQPLIETTEELKRGFNEGLSSNIYFENSTQLSPDEPVVLSRGRFRRPRGNGMEIRSFLPTNGVLLWLERVDPEASH